MNNITVETTIEGAMKAYITTKNTSDMSRDPRQIEEVLHDQGVSYTSTTVTVAHDGSPKTRVLGYTSPTGWKRTVLASLEGPGVEGAYYDTYDYFSGVVSLSRDDWLIVAEKLERKYS
jgi:hypothetical protein